MKKNIVIVCILILLAVIIGMAGSYALYNFDVTKNTNFKLTVGSLEFQITDNETEDIITLSNLIPTKDSDALNDTSNEYSFSIKNKGTINANYQLFFDDISLENGVRINDRYIKVRVYNETTGSANIYNLNSDESFLLENGTINSNTTYNYNIKIWLDYNAPNSEMGKYFAGKIKIVGTQENYNGVYKEASLNGAYPILNDNLVPIVMSSSGEVRKADINNKWYSYENKEWANAVVLEDDSINYEIGEVIPESNIESYFVWLPKYSYQLFDLGNYNSLTSLENNNQPINIRFGTLNTSDSVIGECTTPLISGESGNCQVGDYMTHPAFLTFNTNGLWVGKYESGLKGSNSLLESELNSSDPTKVIIKPNTYSWRNISVGNIFTTSYNYLRNSDSHMMKNTELGAITYLTHSSYGSIGNLIDQTTSGNITGIYDINGNNIEYLASYIENNYGESSLDVSSYDNKYFDIYNSNSTNTSYNLRILGDATGEFGPFDSNSLSSWYGVDAYFVNSLAPWFIRSGLYSFNASSGSANSNITFRIVLAPTNN